MPNILTKIFGRSVKLEFSADPNIIGGIQFSENGFVVTGAVNGSRLPELAGSGDIKIDASQSNSFTITLVGDITSVDISKASLGSYMIIVKQDSIGGHSLSFGSSDNYKFINGVAPTVTQTANAVDIYGIFYDGDIFYIFQNQNFLFE